MNNFSESDKEFLDMTQGERKNLGSAEPCMSELNGNRLDFSKPADGVNTGLGKVYDEAEGLTQEAFEAAMPKNTGQIFSDKPIIFGTADQTTGKILADPTYGTEGNEEVFRLLEEARNLVGNPGTNISSSTDFACDQWHKDYNAWKSQRDDLEQEPLVEEKGIKQCEFDMGYAGRCKGNSSPYSKYCKTHEDMTCVSCGKQATHQCTETLQLVCGSPLCDNCSHSPVNYGPNHIPIKK